MREDVREFFAMGTKCSVEVIGPSRAGEARRAEARVAELERLWSRFLPDSEVSRINETQVGASNISPITVDLLTFALDAWKATGGLFNPFGQKQIVSLGYRKSFERLAMCTYDLVAAPVDPQIEWLINADNPPMVIDRQACLVSTLPGVGVDVGGVAKGFAADVVANELIEAGAQAVMVNLGGDIACRVSKGIKTTWTVEVEDPLNANRILASLLLRSGGVATSCVTHRVWSAPNGHRVHHLIDPRTGMNPVESLSSLCSVSIAADSCAHAEVLTKVAIFNGLPGLREISSHMVPDVFAVAHDESVVSFGAWSMKSRLT
jgi:FAD:protein FMN transferase